MIRRHGAFLGLIVVSIGLMVSACTGRSSQARLNVQIRELPSNASANVVISGPGSFRALVSRSVTLNVRRGTYRIESRGVPIGSITYYTQNLSVSAYAPGSVVLDYAEQVPVTTKVLDGRNLGLAPRTTPTTSSISFTRGAAGAALERGDVLVVNPGPVLPDGLIGRVRDVRVLTSTVTVTLAPATLRDAMPRGSWHTRFPIDPTGVVGLRSGGFRCTATVSGDASVTLSGYIDFDFAWGVASPNYVKLVGGVNEDGKAKVAIKDGGGCTLKADSSPYLLPSFTFALGPLLIDVKPEFVVHGEAAGTFTSGPPYGFQQSAWARAGFSWGTPDGSNQDLHPIAGAGASFSATQPPESPSENYWAGFGPQLNFDIGIIDGGPYVNMLLGISVANNLQSDGTYRYTGISQLRFNAGVRASWGPLQFSVGHPFTLSGSTLFEGTYGAPTTTPSLAPSAGTAPACLVLAPAALKIDLATALPGRALSLHSAAPNQNGVLTKPPGSSPGADQPGAAASCQWLGTPITPSPPYFTRYDLNVVLSIVPYASSSVAQDAWTHQLGPPTAGLPEPTGIGDAAEWVYPGIEDANAVLSVRSGRFLYVVANNETGVNLKGDTEAIARTVASELPH